MPRVTVLRQRCRDSNTLAHTHSGARRSAARPLFATGGMSEVSLLALSPAAGPCSVLPSKARRPDLPYFAENFVSIALNLEDVEHLLPVGTRSSKVATKKKVGPW